MKPKVDYNKYKGVDFALIDDKISARAAVCLYCCNKCMSQADNPRLAAYKCNNTKCPLNHIKNSSMKKEHKLTEEQKEQFRQQLVINRSKKKYTI